MAEQLTATKFLTDDQKKALAGLTADKRPTLIYAYAEKDRIVAATRGSFRRIESGYADWVEWQGLERISIAGPPGTGGI